MTKEIEKIQDAMNDYLVDIQANKTLMYNNLNLFYKLSCYIEQGLFEHYHPMNEFIDESKISPITLFDKFQWIQAFHTMLGIEFDLEQNIKDGTIHLMYYDLFNDNDDLKAKKRHEMNYGRCFCENSKHLINIPNTGLITDVVIAVHEISHLRDCQASRLNQTSDLLTEALAYTEEFICMDFLAKQGYQEEMNALQYHTFYSLYKLAKQTRPIYKMFLLHQQFGTISKETYQSYFKEDNEYEAIIKYMSQLAKTKSFDLHYKSRYIIAAPIATYMYIQYKNDKRFLNSISELRNKMGHCELSSCLKSIGLQNFDQQDKIKLANSLKAIKAELNKVSESQPTTQKNTVNCHPQSITNKIKVRKLKKE